MWKIVQALRRSCKCKKRKTGTKKRLAKRSQKGGYKVGTIKKQTHS